MTVEYDVGDFNDLRRTINDIESDPAKVKSEERKSRFPYFDVIGVLGGWSPRRIVVNIVLLICSVIFRSYLVYWESALFASFFTLYLTESGRRRAFKARDVARYFRAEEEQRPLIGAEIILSHQQYFINATSSPTNVGRHFRHVRFMNGVARITSNLPLALYGAGLAFILSFGVVQSVDLILLGVFLVIGALLALPLAVVASMSVDRARRSIPPVMRKEDVEVALSEEQAIQPRVEPERKEDSDQTE